MNIAIIGYGRMGKEIEKASLARKHKVVLKIDADNIRTIRPENFKNVDVAIEFTNPDSAYLNINLCFDHNIPVVSGTTGWLDQFDDVINRCKAENQSFFYASNYSIGVNLFFKLNSYLAKIMDGYENYDVEVEETHHTKKLDAPSGTAITITNEIVNRLDRKNSWEKEKVSQDKSVAVRSFREGEVPGNHKVIYESSYDKITIEHDAKSREGFALGAVLAAEFIADKKGCFTMDDMLKI